MYRPSSKVLMPNMRPSGSCHSLPLYMRAVSKTGSRLRDSATRNAAAFGSGTSKNSGRPGALAARASNRRSAVAGSSANRGPILTPLRQGGATPYPFSLPSSITPSATWASAPSQEFRKSGRMQPKCARSWRVTAAACSGPRSVTPGAVPAAGTSSPPWKPTLRWPRCRQASSRTVSRSSARNTRLSRIGGYQLKLEKAATIGSAGKAFSQHVELSFGEMQTP